MDNLYGLTEREMTDLLTGWGQPAFRGTQLFSWVQGKQVEDYSRMVNLPGTLRQELDAHYSLYLPDVVTMQTSLKNDTQKALLRLEDGLTVETVLMRYRRRDARDRNTVCVSSQVGCAMGCPFCATGQGGLQRSLSAAEILGQIVRMNKLLKKDHPQDKVTNVVFMGMGEPLHNTAAVLKAIRLLGDPGGLNIGARRITVSTCGLVPGIRQLAGEGLGVTLAVSLHGATNEVRDRLVPVNRTYPLEELIDACRDYFETTGRRITFEYALIEGENDRQEDARQLGRLLRGLNCQVNLIPLNPIQDGQYCRSPGVRGFVRLLEGQGIEAVVREEMGADIDAACGQLSSTQKEM